MGAFYPAAAAAGVPLRQAEQIAAPGLAARG